MKGKGKQDILSLMSFILSTKDCLCKRKGVSNVQMAIAVRIRKCNEERLVGSVIGVGFKRLFAFPHGLYFNLIGTKGITLGCTLWGAHRERRHCVGRCIRAHDGYFVAVKMLEGAGQQTDLCNLSGTRPVHPSFFDHRHVEENPIRVRFISTYFNMSLTLLRVCIFQFPETTPSP